MVSENNETVFDQIQRHEARNIIEERQKFRWRYTTLRNDFDDLKAIYELDIPYSTELTQQLETQGYVFEVERRLHHYLSGLYTLCQQQQTILNMTEQPFREDLGQIKGDYRRRESSRTIMGLRHYAQHENVLPLLARTSALERSNSLVIVVGDLHRSDGDRNFEESFGHIKEPYFDPINWTIDNWSDVEQFFEDTVDVMQEWERANPGLSELNSKVDEIYDVISEDIRKLQDGN